MVQLRHAEQPDGTRGLTAEQERYVRTWTESDKDILVLKPRQMGMSTIVGACWFHRLYMSGDPFSLLCMAHESGACDRFNMMFRVFAQSLPGPLRPPLNPDNMKAIGFTHNDAVARMLMAGGRGQGRSYTYNGGWFSEMGQWPMGSASTKTDKGVDENVWASANATIHGGRRTVEFTGNGPFGIGYKMVLTARESDEWDFLFFPWFEIVEYQVEPPPDWERLPDEQDLAEIMAAGLQTKRSDPAIDRKLAWRRRKLVDDATSLRDFRREYPSTWEEPFLLAESTWFDGELLNRLLGLVPPHWRRDAFHGALRVYHQPEGGRRYFVGMDTSGGTGKDHAAIVVLRDDFEIAAVWSSNTTPPHAQGDMGAKLSAMFNRAEVLCEENNYGRAVIRRMEDLGAPCWKDERGKNFWTQGGRAGQTKKMVYGHARELVDKQGCCSVADGDRLRGINDESVLAELLVVREGDRGNIEAPEGQHDDHADAYVLALWCGRAYYERRGRPVNRDRLKLGRILAAGRMN